MLLEMGTALISNLDATTETRHDRAGQEVMGRVNEKLVTIFHRQYETERGGGGGRERERGREGGRGREREGGRETDRQRQRQRVVCLTYFHEGNSKKFREFQKETSGPFTDSSQTSKISLEKMSLNLRFKLKTKCRPPT